MSKELQIVQRLACRQKRGNVLKVKDLISKLRIMHEIEIREDNFFLCYTMADNKLLKEFEEREIEDWFITRNHGNEIIVINVKGEC